MNDALINYQWHQSESKAGIFLSSLMQLKMSVNEPWSKRGSLAETQTGVPWKHKSTKQLFFESQFIRYYKIVLSKVIFRRARQMFSLHFWDFFLRRDQIENVFLLQVAKYQFIHNNDTRGRHHHFYSEFFQIVLPFGQIRQHQNSSHNAGGRNPTFSRPRWSHNWPGRNYDKKIRKAHIYFWYF